MSSNSFVPPRTIVPQAPGEGMVRSLASRMTTVPKLRYPSAAADRVEEWLASIAGSQAAPALVAHLAEQPLVLGLLRSLVEASPYLWRLATEQPDRLARVLDCDPDSHLETMLAANSRAVAAAHDDTEVMRLLRRLKQEAALLIALADIGGVSDFAGTTRALTALADHAVGVGVRHLLRSTAQEGKLTLRDIARPDYGSGYFAVAMGKMGAFELNYSSDVDLMVFFDPDAIGVAPHHEPGPVFVRMTQRLVKLLQERTTDGYVFRVDLRLRPDPGSTPIAMSTVSAINYYESTGLNWERAALIKARPCAGDIAAAEAFLQELTPFIWRKYLDYAAIADVHAMKRQIHAFRGHGEIAVEGHNVKLGRGGIREIEFFVQTQQLIAGGRHPELRGRETLTMLERLKSGGWISATAAGDLARAYDFLRVVEHRLQMVADEQTHTLPVQPARLDEFARFLGFVGRDAFAADLVAHMRHVQQHYGALFENVPQRADQLVLQFPTGADDPATLDKLTAMGFQHALVASATIRNWFTGAYRSLRGEFARRHLAELVPAVLEHFSRTDAPDRTLAAFDRFLANLHGGARLISLLLRNPDLIALLSLTLGAAPRLADVVAVHPEAVDGLLDPAFFGALPDAATLEERLKRSINPAQPYEDFLDQVRMFGQEHIVLVGARILSGTISAEQAGEAFARLADTVIRVVYGAVTEAFHALHGGLAGEASAVLALGKLGGREMTAGSDLDLILVYDYDQERPQSDGRRPLFATQFFARLTQRLISALGSPTNYGSVYQVDLRLRPSGRSGPVATSIERFRQYHEEEAWTWEHMALTRARVVSSSPQFAQRIEGVIRDVLCRVRDRNRVADDILEMRDAIAREKGDRDPFDLKYVSGGLIDVEFLAQYLQLVHAAAHPDILDTSTIGALDKAFALGVLEAKHAEVLRPAARLYQDLTQLLRLCLDARSEPKAAGAELWGLLARAADVPDFGTLEAHLAETRKQVRTSFMSILGGRG